MHDSTTTSVSSFTTLNNDNKDQFSNKSPSQIDENSLTIRSLVSTKEAGVIIGKGGKNVAELRNITGVKAGVSKVVQGVYDRVLTVTGTLEGVAKAYTLISKTLSDNDPTSPIIIRLLISHNLMGTVIGRQGAKIKHIQDISGVRMVASKALLPQSTERVVEVKGTADAIHKAILEIGRCLIEDKERAYGTILYNPTKVIINENRPIIRTGNGSDFSNSDIRIQNISIPSDMVGCIIGKGGSKISEIRQLSGSRISIAKVPHDDSGERMFTIQGTPEANERALYLLYGQLENEKERRLRSVMNDNTP
ncbi:uncharacterized protein BX663DRAFT_425434 [Cokeromyces recurvatus]|uniref:uncharacterized protein n=1 Tax=Cokeromyces recurvatus TaxID=90255 RepID=UPI00221EDD1B|nr:uncharacterized protein BX663DRAFT_425434 [Cokeromyces recurvatus]KAI7907804.1 hypothetical protein BX663DRAFT_425434 [Cokeromyces recurvatus]